MKISNKHRSGFALVLALVVMTLIFVASSGLYLTRQMWAFNSAKHLDMVCMDLSTRADGQSWVFSLRDYIQINNGIDFATSPLSATPSSITYPGSVFEAALPYPQYPVSLGALPLNLLFNTGAPNTLPTYTPNSQGAGDLFFGGPALVGRLGILFRKEVPTSYGERATGYSPTTTRVRAWYSIDGALPLVALFRPMPVSAFTHFVGRRSSDVSPSVATLGSWLIPSAASYTLGDYSVSSVGSGRIYVEGLASVTDSISTGFPLVASDGITVAAGQSIGLNFPNSFGGGNILAAWTTAQEFSDNRLSSFRGMLITAQDAPTRLLRVGSALINRKWRGSSVLDLSNALAAYAAVTLTCNIATQSISVVYDPSQFSGSPGDIASLTNAANWTFSPPEVIFHPPLGFFSGFGMAPTSLVIRTSGVGASSSRIRLRIPSVSALSSGGTIPLTVIVPANLVILEGGFNSASPGVAAMVVAPTVGIAHSTPPVASYVINGVIITESSSNDTAIRYFSIGTPPVVRINGSLVVWRLLGGFDAWTSASLTLAPLSSYLDGSLLPPLVPAVTDVRGLSDGFQFYDTFAVEPAEELE